MDLVLAEQDIREVPDATGRDELMVNVGGDGRCSREGMNLNDGERFNPGESQVTLDLVEEASRPPNTRSGNLRRFKRPTPSSD